ncbi:glutamate ligase domain-containing protein [Mesotoga sp. Brook.08.YT.4.2.5.4.]|uniref:glutamate ligase domain-containing protein n=1 Tax=Mesotoga sp. Brook.08.YT.4.2.5.4. TaxID=1343998 RepID=UPI0021AC88B7|nr:cyanophycin synthetase [Mesotoga sp. Brook.08.YT.4.2.5.4.]
MISGTFFFFDDYAHTPDEISSTIRGAREFFPGKNVIVVFQPHRYSRLVRENGRFAMSLKDASEVCVYKLYEAYEKGEYAIDETEVLKGLSSYGVPAVHAVNYTEILEWLEKKRDAVILFLGAGDITEASKMSALKLCEAH